jgi:hypothetical protein
VITALTLLADSDAAVVIFTLALMLIGLSLAILWVWMLVECVTREPSEGNDKIVWLLIILLLGWIGALVYFFARRPERIRRFGS